MEKSCRAVPREACDVDVGELFELYGHEDITWSYGAAHSMVWGS